MYTIAQIINIVGNENGMGTRIARIIIAIQSQNTDEHPFIEIIFIKVSKTLLIDFFICHFLIVVFNLIVITQFVKFSFE